MDIFPFCGAIAFFSSSSTKRAALERLDIMQSYTNRADELYLEAENVKLADYVSPFTSCYKTLYQQEELIKRARTMEDSARQIRHQFQTIAGSGFPLPTSTMLRIAIVLVKKGKLMFSTEQLSCVVQMIMENKFYLLFRPKSDTKDYVILVFCSTNFDDTLSSIQKNAEVIKKEVLADGYQFQFKVENIPSQPRFTLYMLNNNVTLAVQNNNNCHLPPVDHKSFLSLLEVHNITTMKKRKLSDAALPMVSELPQTIAQSLKTYL